MGTGNDFFDKTVNVGNIDSPSEQGAVEVADTESRGTLQDILVELKAIQWQLAIMNNNDPDEIRRDVS